MGWCRGPGVGRATVYRHFASREQLVRAIVDRALQDARDAVIGSRPEDGTALEALTRAVESLMRVADRYRLVMAISPHDVELRRRVDEVRVPLQAIIERGQEEGVVRRDLPARWGTSALGALLQAVTVEIIDGAVAESQAVPLIVDTLVDGLRPHDA